ncbi:MAG: phosphodiester glycosidase family protein [Clostridia bacterium]|nr:phosphodiester glycosidase family protein [Clostridia bacterium]
MRKPFPFLIKLLTVLSLMLQLFLSTGSADDGLTEITAYQPVNGVEVRLIDTVVDGEFFKYQVVECDLSNPNLTFTSLYPSDGAKVLKPTLTIAGENGAKVAMNADYFNRGSESGQGSAVGYNAKDGKMISNALEESVYSFSYRQDGQYSFDIFSTQIKIGFSDRVFEYVKTYNKHSSLEGVALFDSHWGEESLGSYGTLVELVIEDGMLTEIRRDMPPIKIPENGYVLAGLSDLTTLFEQVQVGDTVSLEILTTPDLSFVPDFTVGGGSLLVKEGELVKKMSYPKYSDSFPALGISEDGKTIWMITAVNQKGLTQKKMAELCQKEGAYYAFSLDGGGSTQCAVIDNTTGELSYIHELASGYERPVANAVGLISDYPDAKPFGIVAEDMLLYRNIPQKINFSVYDENGLPITIEETDVSFSVKNNTATVKDGFLYGDTVGKDILVIAYEDVVKELQITIVEPAIAGVKQKNGTYRVTNQDGYTRTVTEEEFQLSDEIPVADTLPVVDKMAENSEAPLAFSFYDGGNRDNTLFERLLPAKTLEKLPSGVNPFSKELPEHPYLEMVYIDNSGGQILGKDMTEWNKLTKTLDSQKNNLIFVMKEPLIFLREQETDLFYKTLTTAHEKGKNILILVRGKETKLQKMQDGIRVLSLEKEEGTIDTFLEKETHYLSVFCNESQMNYQIFSKKLFEN